jgi:hypothetical protein
MCSLKLALCDTALSRRNTALGEKAPISGSSCSGTSKVGLASLNGKGGGGEREREREREGEGEKEKERETEACVNQLLMRMSNWHSCSAQCVHVFP